MPTSPLCARQIYDLIADYERRTGRWRKAARYLGIASMGYSPIVRTVRDMVLPLEADEPLPASHIDIIIYTILRVPRPENETSASHNFQLNFYNLIRSNKVVFQLRKSTLHHLIVSSDQLEAVLRLPGSTADKSQLLTTLGSEKLNYLIDTSEKFWTFFSALSEANLYTLLLIFGFNKLAVFITNITLLKNTLTALGAKAAEKALLIRAFSQEELILLINSRENFKLIFQACHESEARKALVINLGYEIVIGFLDSSKLLRQTLRCYRHGKKQQALLQGLQQEKLLLLITNATELKRVFACIKGNKTAEVLLTILEQEGLSQLINTCSELSLVLASCPFHSARNTLLTLLEPLLNSLIGGRDYDNKLAKLLVDCQSHKCRQTLLEALDQETLADLIVDTTGLAEVLKCCKDEDTQKMLLTCFDQEELREIIGSLNALEQVLHPLHANASRKFFELLGQEKFNAIIHSPEIRLLITDFGLSGALITHLNLTQYSANKANEVATIIANWFPPENLCALIHTLRYFQPSEREVYWRSKFKEQDILRTFFTDSRYYSSLFETDPAVAETAGLVLGSLSFLELNRLITSQSWRLPTVTMLLSPEKQKGFIQHIVNSSQTFIKAMNYDASANFCELVTDSFTDAELSQIVKGNFISCILAAAKAPNVVKRLLALDVAEKSLVPFHFLLKNEHPNSIYYDPSHLIKLHRFIKATKRDLLRDQYWQIADAIANNSPSQLRYALQGIIYDENFLLTCCQWVVSQAKHHACLAILLADNRFNLYARMSNGSTLEHYIERTAPLMERKKYLDSLHAARSDEQKQALVRLNSLSASAVKLPTELYNDDRLPCEQMSSTEKATWLIRNAENALQAGEELTYRIQCCLSYLKEAYPRDAEKLKYFERNLLRLENNTLQLEDGISREVTEPAFWFSAAEALLILPQLEEIVSISAAIPNGRQGTRWFHSNAEQIGYCQSGVYNALNGLLNTNPLASEKPLRDRYNGMTALLAAEVSKYLLETRGPYEQRQSVHAGADMVYGLCGLQPPAQADDTFFLSPIPKHVQAAMALQLATRGEEGQLAFGANVAGIIRDVSDFLSNELLAEYKTPVLMDTLCNPLTEETTKRLTGLGISVGDILEISHSESLPGKYEVKLASAEDLADIVVEALKRKGVIAYSPAEIQTFQEEVRAALCCKDLADTEALARIEKHLAKPWGKALIAFVLYELQADKELQLSRLLTPIPNQAGSILSLLGADPIFGYAFLSGKVFLPPSETLPPGESTTPAEYHIAPLITTRLNYEERNDLFQQLLFTPGAARTALMFLQEPSLSDVSERSELLEAMGRLAQKPCQHALVDYPGSFIGYLFKLRRAAPIGEAASQVIRNFLDFQIKSCTLTSPHRTIIIMNMMLEDASNHIAAKQLLLETLKLRQALLNSKLETLARSLLVSLCADPTFQKQFKAQLEEDVRTNRIEAKQRDHLLLNILKISSTPTSHPATAEVLHRGLARLPIEATPTPTGLGGVPEWK